MKMKVDCNSVVGLQKGRTGQLRWHRALTFLWTFQTESLFFKRARRDSDTQLLLEEVLLFPVTAKSECKLPVMLLRSDKERENCMCM